jgi:hypothetical protein
MLCTCGPADVIFTEIIGKPPALTPLFRLSLITTGLS